MGSTPAPVDLPGDAVGPRFAELEAYRGLAALCIVVYTMFQFADAGNPALFDNHGSVGYVLLSGLDVFVDVFFVLSAFLLSLPYARDALSGTRSTTGLRFIGRRAARIVPLYVVAVFVVWIVRNPQFPGDLVDLVEHLTFTQIYDQKRIFYTIGPAWSLAVEVHFYVLLAAAGAGAYRICARLPPARRLRLLVGVPAAVALLSLVWKLVAWFLLDVRGDQWPTWFGFPAKLDVFAFGVLLAVVVADGRLKLDQRGALITRAAGLAALILALALRPHVASQPAWFHTVGAAGLTALLASSVLGPHDRWVQVLGRPAVASLGLLSYSLYLWHEPVLLALVAIGVMPPRESAWLLPIGLLVLLPVAWVVAWLSYHFIERSAATVRVVASRGRRDYYDGT